MSRPISLRSLMVSALLILLIMVARVAYEGRAELSRAQAAAVEGRRSVAIEHYERAIHWYLPGSPVTEEALRMLWTIGRAAEEVGDREGALEAYQAVRSGLLAVRSFYTPFADWLARANDRIAALQVQDPDASWPDPQLSDEQRKLVAMNALLRDDAPDVFWSLVTVFGMLVWIGSAIGFIFGAFEPSGRFVPHAGLRWALGIVAGYASWVVGMTKA